MKFVAIDFETANEKRSSPCSIGIVVVNNGQVVEKVYYLIKPKEMRFTPINIGIHGIRPAMVKHELEFHELWERIKDYFNDTLVVAHNAAFDISVLRNTLQLYNIYVPSFRYICTMKLSRNFYCGLENAKLNTVNKFLGYEFNHHDALEDALACANILIRISEELNTNDINYVSKVVGVTLGNVNNEGYKPSSTTGRVLIKSGRDYYHFEKSQVKELNYNVFREQVLVFTGPLKSMPRDEAMRLVRNLGGSTGSSVTRKTTYLVTNVQNIGELERDEMSIKLRRAMDLIDTDQKIKIINEEEFLNKCYY